MEPSYVIVSIPADGGVIDAFTGVDAIWQFVFCLSSEGQLVPIIVFKYQKVSLELK